jgi:YebC/PmpR family DNA-binding regulatory protein
MAGHSKWNNIKRKKEGKDNARAKVFTKISREILVCVRESGSADPNTNSKLRELVAKAKSNNIPNDNIDRLLKKAVGGEKSDYDHCLYEGYGPAGIAVMVSCLTDNRNRTASEMRHAFDKYGGNLGNAGCVAFMFAEKGVVLVDNEDEAVDQEAFFEQAGEAGADDFEFADGVIEVYCEVNTAGQIGETLAAQGYRIISAQNEQLPSTYTTLSDDEQVKKMTTLLEVLEDNDDVQNVWHNWDC